MTEIIINGENWLDKEVQKYWAFPSSYTQEKKEQEIHNIIFSDAYVATEKRDGHLYFFMKDENGEFYLRSRSKGVNGWNIKTGHVPHLHDFFSHLPNNTVLLGEICFMNNKKTSKDVTSIMGCKEDKAIARQEQDENKVYFFIFDVLVYGGVEYHEEGALDRLCKLEEIEEKHTDPFVVYTEKWTDPESIHDNWLRILKEDGEGVILTQKDYPYSFNKRTARKTLKLKKELAETIDVFLTGRYTAATYEYTGKEKESWRYWYNPITKKRLEGDYFMTSTKESLDAVTMPWFMGWAGSVEIGMMKDGKPIPVGNISNVTNKVKEGIVSDNDEYKGKVLELQAMEIDRSGETPTLRHAKIVQWRDDKNAEDCDWGQLF